MMDFDELIARARSVHYVGNQHGKESALYEIEKAEFIDWLAGHFAPKAQRSYTLSEIDEMRANLDLVSAGGYSGTSDQLRQLEQRNEERLRTYLLAGIDPKELRAKAKARTEALEKMPLVPWR